MQIQEKFLRVQMIQLFCQKFRDKVYEVVEQVGEVIAQFDVVVKHVKQVGEVGRGCGAGW